MTVTTGAAAEQSALSEGQRDALVSEMSRLQQILEPDAHHCFCGDDRMLVETVHELRERVERELGDDEPEL
ncbi:hypothetical protein [Actinomycetospora soli]|uniref:hypothetical protein n=1 Tax=Actinomycetospora soli TaxID=2893887 RepID=UPI001E36655E|nr:hypothetical protein [Actinomycetospora soli]MCD2191310.1 hypothetical protein [Actinomycetospora soli]